MPTQSKSHVKNGNAYFKHTGRYNEVTKAASNQVNNDSPKAGTQKNLAKKGTSTAAATSLNKAWAELGWKK